MARSSLAGNAIQYDTVEHGPKYVTISTSKNSLYLPKRMTDSRPNPNNHGSSTPAVSRRDKQTQTTDEVGSRDRLVSLCLNTCQSVQRMVRGCEAQVNRSTDQMTGLMDKVKRLREELARKEALVRQLRERNSALESEDRLDSRHRPLAHASDSEKQKEGI